jgi:hypothetical protein
MGQESKRPSWASKQAYLISWARPVTEEHRARARRTLWPARSRRRQRTPAAGVGRGGVVAAGVVRGCSGDGEDKQHVYPFNWRKACLRQVNGENRRRTWRRRSPSASSTLPRARGTRPAPSRLRARTWQSGGVEFAN